MTGFQCLMLLFMFSDYSDLFFITELVFSHPSQLLDFFIIHQGVLSFCVYFFGIISPCSICTKEREGVFMADNRKERERDELHRTIRGIANDLRGSVDGWDFKQYVLGMLF